MTIHNKIFSTLLAGAVFPDGMFESYKECGRKWQREGLATLSNPQPSPPCSLTTVRASLSSRNPANLECRR